MRIFWIAILVAGAAGVACQQSPVVPIIVTPVIELNIKVSDSVLVFGEVDTILVVIKNTLEDAARISFATQCQDLVYIRNLSGNVVLPATGKYTCPAVLSQLTIPAKDSVVRTYFWTGGQSFSPPDPAAKLPVGRYFVSADLQGTNYSVSAFPVGIRLATTR